MKEYKSELSKRMATPCMPPKQYLQFAYHFWVGSRDGDNRMTAFPIVMQWQPGANSWCLPGQIATGQINPLYGYEVIALCPTPLLQPETEDLMRILYTIKNRFGTDKKAAEITDVEYDLLHRYIFEAMSMQRDFNKTIRTKLDR